MAIYKSIQADAPYSSGTFNANNNYLANVNGLLSGGKTTTSGGIVTVQALSWIQAGLIVSSNVALPTVGMPTLAAPFYVVVSSSTSIEDLGETITPTFVKRPQDVTGNMVLVAEWNGTEWRTLPYISMQGLSIAYQARALNGPFIGIASGLDVTLGGSTLTVQAGTGYTTDGAFFQNQQSKAFTLVTADSHGFGRIDELVVRKPIDSIYRTAMLRYVTGPAYSQADALTHVGATINLGDGAHNESQAKILNNPYDNSTFFVFVQDPGGTNDLMLAKGNDAFTLAIAPTQIATGVGTFDAIFTPDGFVDVVYTKSTNLYYQRYTIGGVQVYAETPIYTGAVVIANPKAVTVLSTTTYYIHVVFEVQANISDRLLGYVRVSSSNTIVTPYQILVDLSATLLNPSLAKDDDDTLFFLAFENNSTARAYLRTFDANTATGSAPPAQLGASVELQTDTYNISTSTELGATGATNPIVIRTQNKQTFAFWRQDKGGGNYGVAVYNVNYLAAFGHKALMQDLYTSGDLVSSFDVDADGLNNGYFIILATSGAAYKAAMTLETFTILGDVFQLVSANATAVTNLFTSRGCLANAFSLTTPQLAVKLTTAGVEQNLRDDYTPGSDFQVAHYRTEDEVLSVRGTSLEEDITIRRLYEFTNLFAGAQGSITWGAAIFTMVSASATAGAVYEDLSSNQYTVLYTVVAGSTIAMSGTTQPPAAPSTLTKISGTGDSHISYTGIGSYQTLIINPAIEIQFLNRLSTYTIAANNPTGVQILPGQALVVQIPDTDADATLTPSVITFGEGPLDRHTRNTFPLFWNISGNLYMRFAPYRVDVGETIVVGQPMSANMLAYIGTTTINPNPNNHGYSSAVIIEQSDSHDSALGKLDAALGAIENSFLEVTQALTVSTTQQVITFGVAQPDINYKVLPAMWNTTDLTPQIQGMQVIAKTRNNFTVEWNAPLDTGNYSADFLIFQPGSAGGLSIAQSLVAFEQPVIGAGDGSTQTFSTLHTPVNNGVVMVYVNSLYVPPTDYTILLEAITFTDAPAIGSQIVAAYWYQL